MFMMAKVNSPETAPDRQIVDQNKCAKSIEFDAQTVYRTLINRAKSLDKVRLWRIRRETSGSYLEQRKCIRKTQTFDQS